jgi:hypothetical protein
MRRYLLDTNIVSLLAQPQPDPRVLVWLREQSPLALSLSVLVLGEIEKGIRRLPDGRRRDELLAWSQNDLPSYFRGRVLSVDLATAREWGRLDAEGRQSGRPLPVVDGLMLATAARHGLILVTRNVSDCAQRGHPVFDPFTGTLHG